MAVADARDWSDQFCDDETFIAAPPEAVFAVLLDIAGWNGWWETMTFAPLQDGPLKPGDKAVFDGVVSKWTVEVLSVDAPRSIRFRYAEGALVGETEWRVRPVEGGCLAAYVYHGVRAMEDRAASTFGRFGTELHTMVMQADALDGLRRLATGQPCDEAWRQSVRDRVAAGRQELIARESAE